MIIIRRHVHYVCTNVYVIRTILNTAYLITFIMRIVIQREEQRRRQQRKNDEHSTSSLLEIIVCMKILIMRACSSSFLSFCGTDWLSLFAIRFSVVVEVAYVCMHATMRMIKINNVEDVIAATKSVQQQQQQHLNVWSEFGVWWYKSFISQVKPK